MEHMLIILPLMQTDMHFTLTCKQTKPSFLFIPCNRSEINTGSNRTVRACRGTQYDISYRWTAPLIYNIVCLFLFCNLAILFSRIMSKQSARCSVSTINLIVPGSFRMHFLHRYRRNLYFISVLCSYSTQLSADKTQGSPGAPGQIFRPREVSKQGPKPQGHFSLTQTSPLLLLQPTPSILTAPTGFN